MPTPSSAALLANGHFGLRVMRRADRRWIDTIEIGACWPLRSERSARKTVVCDIEDMFRA
jgi:hypothetical protein